MRHALTMTDAEFAAATPETVAMVPLGAMESHGPHLPIGTDTILSEAVLDAAAAALDDGTTAPPVLRLPALWLGASREHSARAGTLSLSDAQMVEVIGAAVIGLANSGVRRVLLVNAHGGNISLSRQAALNARVDAGVLCAAMHWQDFGLPDQDARIPEALRSRAAQRRDVHGGWIETSMMLAHRPELVRSPLPPGNARSAPAPSLFPVGPVHWGWMSDDLGADGYIGSPELATAQIGQAILEHAGAAVAQVVRDLAAARLPASKV
ncbi:MAG: creatininase family protein [Pseudomonadota bacterium]